MFHYYTGIKFVYVISFRVSFGENNNKKRTTNEAFESLTILAFFLDFFYYNSLFLSSKYHFLCFSWNTQPLVFNLCPYHIQVYNILKLSIMKC